LFLIINILSTGNIRAENEFEREVEVSYEASSTGITTVTHNINLINKTSNYYADKYEIKLGSTKVDNVKAFDNVGSLETEVKFENNITSITITLGQRVIGIGKSSSWTLSYTSEELSTKSGQIWEISIPKLARTIKIPTLYIATLKIMLKVFIIE